AYPPVAEVVAAFEYGNAGSRQPFADAKAAQRDFRYIGKLLQQSAIGCGAFHGAVAIRMENASCRGKSMRRWLREYQRYDASEISKRRPQAAANTYSYLALYRSDR